MKKFILILLLVLLFAIVGFLGREIYFKSKNSTQTAVNNLSTLPENKLSKVQTGKAPEYKEPAEIKVVSGKITEIKGNSIILETVGLEMIKSSPKSREVVVFDATKIFKKDFKDQATFLAEMVEFEKTLEGKSDDEKKNSNAPSMMTEKEIKIAELKVGDRITVEVSENIKTSAKFQVLKIVVEPTAEPSPEDATQDIVKE